MTLPGLRRWALLLGVASLCSGCSDGATRIAYDIESAVAAFRRSDAARYSMMHVPEARPEGCDGAYTVQFTANSSLVIWCRKPDANGTASAVASSHTTTYHLRFVRIPQTFRVDKAAGEATIIELTKQDGAVVMTGVR
jgi:hypothetical protein